MDFNGNLATIARDGLGEYGIDASVMVDGDFHLTRFGVDAGRVLIYVDIKTGSVDKAERYLEHLRFMSGLDIDCKVY